MIIFYCISTLIGGHAKHISLMAAAGSTIRQRRAGLCATLLLLHHHHHRRHFFFLFFCLFLSSFFVRRRTSRNGVEIGTENRHQNFSPKKKISPLNTRPTKESKAGTVLLQKKNKRRKKEEGDIQINRCQTIVSPPGAGAGGGCATRTSNTHDRWGR